ncbi:hypothetical protein J4H86_16835 [Spiractinospora alimapuensis]|uniref:DUF6458 family protein n=1 Tax=Spiractinospora alimapuensis TaxID=2820884 RepID=UPI001F25196C|nr:DUF6458 family protein [Spiractinospora alimapuensis]QVQ55187.1 hypothetical protein J4H86_16835 [Spiractinospora alimapuensis]
MGIGLGIFLAVLGAVLFFGITADVSGLDLQAIGMILMIAGAAIVVITLIYPLIRGNGGHEERLPGDDRRA